MYALVAQIEGASGRCVAGAHEFFAWGICRNRRGERAKIVHLKRCRKKEKKLFSRGLAKTTLEEIRRGEKSSKRYIVVKSVRVQPENATSLSCYTCTIIFSYLYALLVM